MRKLILLTLSIAVCALAQTPSRQRADGWCEAGNKTITVLGYTSSTSTPVQASYPSCTVTVFITNSGGTLATIYADNAGTALANPFTVGVSPETSSIGYWFFYVADGRYDIRFSGTGITTPFTIGDTQVFDWMATLPSTGAVGRKIKDKLTDFVNVKDYGAICNGIADDYAAIQAALDANPQGTVNFPNSANCISSATWILSDVTGRNFNGRLVGNGATITWNNNGNIGDTDANMRHGIGAYNQLNDPNNNQSEIAGVVGVEISGFNLIGPNYGAIMFFGNSQQINIHDNRFAGKNNSYTATVNPRHGIVLDCSISAVIKHNYFSLTPKPTGGTATTPTSFLVSQIAIIQSGDTASGHVVYTNFGLPGCTNCAGYFNDSPVISENFFNAGSPFAIVDHGTGAFTNRTIRDNTAAGGAKGWFYVAHAGMGTLLKNNWVESCTYFAGSLDGTLGGNIPGTTIPHSYLNVTVFGAPEHMILENNQFANITGVFYSEAADTAYTTLTRNRLLFGIPGTTFWVWVGSTANIVEFRDDNLTIYLSLHHVATDRVVNNAAVIPVFTGTFGPPRVQSGYIAGRMQPSCQFYNLSVTAGGHFTVNGKDIGYGAGPLTFFYVYFADVMPANSIITGVSLQTVTPFTGTGLTSLVATIGDGIQASGPAPVPNWFGSTPYNLMAVASNTNHIEYQVFRAPQDITVGHPLIDLIGNTNLSGAAITGSVNINLCWAVMQ